MAEIGTLGDINFSVSRNKIKTFKDMRWSSGANFASHDVHLQMPKLEFTGIESDTIDFTMIFSVFYGTNPAQEINKLEAAERDGEVMRLVIGSKVYGHWWVITKTDKTLKKFDGNGKLLEAEVAVSLKAYS